MMDGTPMRGCNIQRSLSFSASSFLISLVALAALDVRAQNPGSPGLLSIRLEQRKGNTIQAVPQSTVFRNGDILRFRLASRIDGYLYVVDKGTTGSTAVLFPGTSAATSTNHIEINRSYPVPADGDGWFEVSGPAGFDTLYFLVSVSAITLPSGYQPASPDSAHPQSTPPPPPGLLPRCDDAIFKARGECLDGSAGVAPLPPDAAVPRELVPLARTASRDIVLANDGDDTAIQSAPTAKLPLIYTFRLAHRE
jgi:hypothetical protein